MDRIVEALQEAYPDQRKQARERVQALLERATDDEDGLDERQLERSLDAWLDAFPARAQLLATLDAAIADLTDWLRLPEGEMTVIRNLVKRVSDHLKPILSLLAVVATGLYGIAFSRFYDALDTSPEAVGITATQMLARSAVGGVAFLAIGSLVVLSPVAPLIPSLSGSAQDKPRSNGSIGDVAIVGLLSAVVLFLFLGSLGGSLFDCLVVALLPGFFGVLASLRIHGRPYRVSVRPLRFRFVDFALAALITAVIGMAAFADSTIKRAEDLGEEARAGGKISSPTFLGLPILGLRADPALIAWKGREPASLDLPPCVLYLGQSGGTTVVYDPSQLRTVQLSAEDAVLSVQNGRTSCGAPLNYDPPRIRRRAGFLECMPGRWQQRPPTRFAFTWSRDGYGVETRVEDRFRLLGDSGGHSIRCAVEATNPMGSDVAFSKPLILGPGASGQTRVHTRAHG
jgi:hypothetical protein